MNQYVFDPVKPVVETRFGKLRGITYGDINFFMGIRYAKARRFQMPEDPEPWRGVKNAYTYGPVCPLMFTATPPSYYRGLHMLQVYSEDCQNLNIWAPKDISGEKKPVFVWIHGGGYFAGNALEEYSFDGFHMASNGNVVFVSINHRLNILGHLNLADYGEEFRHSVNVGIADLVAAMKWIHENISAFGGDPENVTICGHSGGGGKVQCLYQIEEAAPYFRQGIVLSGCMRNELSDTQECSRKAAAAILGDLGITKENIEKVYEVSYRDLVDAYGHVAQRLQEEGNSPKWSPVADEYFRGFPLDAGFMPWSKDKPLLIGSTLGEFPLCRLTAEEKEAMGEAERVAYLRERYGEEAEKLMALFRKAYPAHDILDLAYTDTMVRIPSMNTAVLHSGNKLKNTYIFLAAYNAPEDNWVPLWHGGDVCYILQNEDRVYVLNEAVYGQKLAKIFSTLTLNFARTGNPNTEYLPEWKPVSAENRNTMVIDRECACLDGFDDDLTAALDPLNPKFFLEFAKMFEKKDP